MGKCIPAADLGDLAAVADGCYLLHFDTPYKHARHYLGHADDLLRRVGEHLMGKSGVKLTTLALAAGVHLTLARLWPGATRDDERRMKGARDYPNGSPKHRGSLAPLCPICQQLRRETARHA